MLYLVRTYKDYKGRKAVKRYRLDRITVEQAARIIDTHPNDKFEYKHAYNRSNWL